MDVILQLALLRRMLAPSWAGNASTRASWKSALGALSVAVTLPPPCTVVPTELMRRIDCDGFTHGPPAWLHPGELKMPISMFSSVAFLRAACMMSHHSSENIFTSPVGASLGGRPMLAMKARLMPAFFMASRSAITPALEMLPDIQCQ